MAVRIGLCCLVSWLLVNQAGMTGALEATTGPRGNESDARREAETTFARGLLAWADADSEAAQSRFLAAAELWPNDATYAFFAGHMALRRDRQDQAALLFAGALPPSSSRIEAWRVHFELGRVRYLSGDLPEAEASLRRALELKPEDAGTLFYLGFALLERQQATEAMSMFAAGRASAPELTADAHYYTGVAAMQLGDTTLARSEFERVIEAGTRRVRHSIPEIMTSTREYLELLGRPGRDSTGTEGDRP